MALTDKINAYLEQNNISVSPGDYQIGQPEGGVDQILHWDGMRLGPEPIQTQLDTAWATKVTQNVSSVQFLPSTIPQDNNFITNLNDKIVVYLKQNNISVVAGDFQTGQPDGEHDQILYWNVMRLGPEPTTDQLISAWDNKLAAEETQKYHGRRQSAYPSITEQLDMLWHAIDSGALDKTSDFYQGIASIKSQFPKP
jgi:hypothetical protein